MRKCLSENLRLSMCCFSLHRWLAPSTFPPGDVFRPLIADPLEPRLFVSMLSLDAPNDTLTARLGRRGRDLRPVPLARRARRERAGSSAFPAGIFSQFNLDAPSKDLINSDFRIGIPVSYKRGPFSARAVDLFTRARTSATSSSSVALAPPHASI